MKRPVKNVPSRLGSLLYIEIILPFSGIVNRASATETIDSGLIPGRVKLKTKKIGIHWLPFSCSLLFKRIFFVFSNEKGQCKASSVYGRQVGTGQVTA